MSPFPIILYINNNDNNDNDTDTDTDNDNDNNNTTNNNNEYTVLQLKCIFLFRILCVFCEYYSIAKNFHLLKFNKITAKLPNEKFAYLIIHN